MEHHQYDVKEVLGMHDISAQFESTNCIRNLMTKQEGMFMLVIETDNMRNKKAHGFFCSIQNYEFEPKMYYIHL